MEAVSIYIHGRPEREASRRNRWAFALLLLLAAALVAAGVWMLVGSSPAGAAETPPPAVVSDQTAPTPVPTALSHELKVRFDEAALVAAADGITLEITSGARTVAEQNALIAEAVVTYGSEAEAHRYVLPAAKSAHVHGLAIDVGPAPGATWLGEHGAAFGLCRTYANEAWHFEPVIEPGGTCPEPRPDSSWGW